MNSKKGIIAVDTIMMGIVRMAEYIIAVFILYALISMFIIAKVDTSKTEGQVYINRIIYATAYQDKETGRHYPGIIDSEKMTTAALAARMKSAGKTAVEISYGNKREVYNERQFNYLFPLAESKIPGKTAGMTKQHMQLILHEKGERPENFDFVAVTAR